MMLAFLLAGVTLIVLATVLGPLWRQTRAPPERAAYDRAVYRDQLKELERDAARGLIGPPEAASARIELQRRLLGADATGAAPQIGKRLPLLAMGLALAFAMGAAALYLRLGAPSVPDAPFAERQAERDQAAQAQTQLAQIKGMVAKLADEMKSHPDDLEGWLRLGRSYAVLGQPDEAANAFAEAERLKPNDPGILMAEAQAWMTGLQISDPIPDRAIDLLRRVQALDPTSQAALWYLGLHAAQSGEFAEARADWEKLLPLMPGDSDERKTVMAALAAIKNK